MNLVYNFVIICFGLSPGYCSYEDGSESVVQDERYVMGKEKYEAIQREASSRPRYSKCWTDALLQVRSGCKVLTDETQHRMALAFTNCFLKKTGRAIYPCSADIDVSSCTGSMTAEAYNTYTEFFTHTQNICFFLQAQVWQEETDNTISRLADNSAHVAQQIEDSSVIQSDIMRKQNESIKNQELLLQHGDNLRQTLKESSVDVHKMLQEFKDSTTEQRAMIFEVFDRLNALQSVVLGEFTGFYSLVFYAISILVCYLLTSTPRTSGARFWLFVLMSLNVMAERILVATANYGDTFDEKGERVDSSALVYRRLWFCRKLFTTAAVSVWMFFAYKYKDYNILNNQLLVEIKKQNSDLKHLLETSTVATPSLARKRPSYLSNDLPAIPRIADYQAGGDCTDLTVARYNSSNTTGYETDSESDSDSDSSTNSVMTDRTYRPDDSDSDESFLSLSSRRNSREGTPAMLDELRFLRESTPIKQMSSTFSPLANDSADINPSDNSFLSPSGTSTPMKRMGRPKGSKNYQNVPREHFSTQNHYNLRHRGPTRNNPQVNTETAEDFSRTVKHLAKVAVRNRMKARYTIQRKNDSRSFFSSDDDRC